MSNIRNLLENVDMDSFVRDVAFKIGPSYGDQFQHNITLIRNRFQHMGGTPYGIISYQGRNPAETDYREAVLYAANLVRN